MNAIISYFLNNWPNITLIVIFVYIVFRICLIGIKYYSHVKNMKEKIDSLPCRNNKNVLDKVERGLINLDKTVKSTNEMVAEICKWIMKNDNNMIDVFVKKQSPSKILPIGYSLLEETNAKKAVDHYMDFLIKELDSENPQAPYDVEDKALTVLMKNISHDLFSEVKSFLYNSPETITLIDPETSEERQIKPSIQIITELMSIYLRDKYLEQHPEIK